MMHELISQQEVSGSHGPFKSIQKQRKKPEELQPILEVQHGCFTPIVMSAYGGIRKGGNKFYNRLAELLVEKKNQQLSVMTS